MIKHAVLFTLATLTAPLCFGSDCDAIQAEIDTDLKHAAREMAYGFAGSITREAAAANMAVHLTQVQTNTSLLIAKQCPLPKAPFTWRVYQKASSACSLEAQRARLAREAIKTDACAVENWEPSTAAE